MPSCAGAAGGMLIPVSLITRARQRQRPGGAGRPARRWFPAAQSLWWLAAVSAAFAAAQLVFVSPHLGLSWDETVYVSQVSGHAPAAYFDAARARGIPLLVAPVTLLTSSATALRLYLSLASGLGLFLALLTWRQFRPAWMLALAGLCFGGLWTAQYYGPQAMPDLWVALCALAAAGFFLQAAVRLSPGASRQPAEPGPQASAPSPQASAPSPQARPPARRAAGSLAGLAVTTALAALVRPGDAVFLAVPLLAAAIVVPAWRRWPLLAATLAGLVAGGCEWAVEAYLRFGGPLHRLHEAGAEQSGFGLHLGFWDELRAVNGPTLCRPCTVGWRHPELGLWWLALPFLVVAGILAARQAGRLGSALLPACVSLALAVQYLFLINYAAPRFLLPAYALAALPVADALGWLCTSVRADLRPLTTGLVALGLAVQLLAQHVVLDHEVGGTITFHNDYTRIVADLRHLGIRPPCLIKGEQFIPIAFYAGCASAPALSQAASGAGQAVTGQAGRPAGGIALLVHPGDRPPRYARSWRRYRLRGTRILKAVAYLSRG